MVFLVSILNNVYKYFFFLRMIVIWNILFVNEDVNINNFKFFVFVFIELFV